MRCVYNNKINKKILNDPTKYFTDTIQIVTIQNQVLYRYFTQSNHPKTRL